MPQFNAYGLITELVADDILLVWQDSAAGNKNISFQDLVDSINALLPESDNVAIISSNTTLDDTYQFVVCNSGGSFNISLPEAADNPGLRFRIGNKGAGTVTVDRSGGDTIAMAGSAGASVDIGQYFTFDFQSDGVDTWFVNN